MFRGTILAWVIIILGISGCTRDKTSNNLCTDCPPDISFSAAMVPIFATNCALSGCHDAATHAGFLNLDSAAAYMGVTEPGTGYVFNNNPNYSLLYTQLLTGAANHMPPTAQLSPCDIQEVYCWIQQGAKNN